MARRPRAGHGRGRSLPPTDSGGASRSRCRLALGTGRRAAQVERPAGVTGDRRRRTPVHDPHGHRARLGQRAPARGSRPAHRGPAPRLGPPHRPPRPRAVPRDPLGRTAGRRRAPQRGGQCRRRGPSDRLPVPRVRANACASRDPAPRLRRRHGPGHRRGGLPRRRRAGRTAPTGREGPAAARFPSGSPRTTGGPHERAGHRRGGQEQAVPTPGARAAPPGPPPRRCRRRGRQGGRGRAGPGA